MGRATKANGKNKHWFNVKDLDDVKSVDFENINGWKNINKEKPNLKS